jgi:putative transposase
MPRLPRLVLPDLPMHLVQRGNDHQPCFLDSLDRRRYLDDLRVLAREADCAIHAYVLMTNHVHLLLTPGTGGRIDRLMQALGRRYVRHFNDRHARSGTLWEGRYKAGPVEADDHLLRCYRYIELNPVRAGIVARAEDYPWSSYGANALGEEDALVSPHPVYLGLGRDPVNRRDCYRALVAEVVPDAETAAIRRQLGRQKALGSETFSALLEGRAERRVESRRRGRPRKERGASSCDEAPPG